MSKEIWKAPFSLRQLAWYWCALRGRWSLSDFVLAEKIEALEVAVGACGLGMNEAKNWNIFHARVAVLGFRVDQLISPRFSTHGIQQQKGYCRHGLLGKHRCRLRIALLRERERELHRWLDSVKFSVEWPGKSIAE